MMELYNEQCTKQLFTPGVPFAASCNTAMAVKQHCSVFICSLCSCLDDRQLNEAERQCSPARAIRTGIGRYGQNGTVSAATPPFSTETGVPAVESQLLFLIEGIFSVDKHSHFALGFVSVTTLTVLNVYVFLQAVHRIVEGDWSACQRSLFTSCRRNDRREVSTLKTNTGSSPSQSRDTACTPQIQNALNLEVRFTPEHDKKLAQDGAREPVQETSPAADSTHSQQPETLDQRSGQRLNCKAMQESEMPRDAMHVADRHQQYNSVFENTATATCGDLKPSQLSLFRPVKIQINREKRINREKARTKGTITTLCLQESLQKAFASMKEGGKQELKSKDPSSSEEQTTEDSNILQELTSARTMRFAPGVQRKVTISMLKGSEGQRSPLEAERNRLASFHDNAKVLKSGIWITKLAAAGFYCKTKDSAIVWCAFCELRIEIEAFKKEDPMTVHRRRSPGCPFVQGQSCNVTIERQGQIAGLNVLHTFFGDYHPQGKEQPKAAEPKDPQHTETPISATESKPCPEALQSASAGGFGSEGGARLSQSAASTVSSTPSAARETGSSSPRSLDGQSPRTSLPAQSLAHVNSLPGGASDAVNRNTQVEATLPEQPSHHAPAQVSRQPARESSATAGNAGPQTPRADPRAQASSPASAQPSEPARPQTPNLVTPQPSVEPGRTHTPESALPFQTARPASPLQPGTTPSASPASSPASNSRQSNGREAASHTQAPPPATGEPVRQVVTYSQLGIYTQEPKRSDFAIATTRVATFNNWCHSHTHSAEEMAEAGFYFVGQGDLVRCFYCKGGLKSWAPHLRPWVEHARFFPKCPFIGQVKGQEFIDVVQELKERQDSISAEEVEEELQARQRNSQDGEAQAQLGSEGAVGGAIGAGGGEEENIDVTQLAKAADDLENENKEILDTRICKICQINDVSILFLPCGHLASCAQCAPALRNCAICRQRVKGRVRVIDQ